MTIEPGTYTASFDVDGNGKVDAIHFSVTESDGMAVLRATVTLDNGKIDTLGQVCGNGDLSLSFSGKNGAAEGMFTAQTTGDGLSSVTFKGVEERYGLIESYGNIVSDEERYSPDFHKYGHNYYDDVYNVKVSKTFSVTANQ